MSTGYASLIVLALILAVVVAVATIRTKAHQRRVRRALGLPAKMASASAETQARHAVRVFMETDRRLRTTARRLSKKQRRAMATAIVKEKGLMPRTPGDN
jgi:hypothetical protein